ncbi:MAG: hypothetical protein HY819_00010 [Acidobacteria bacterium]|nr:hypothetical protein [Acidobacteriota bacterium]
MNKNGSNCKQIKQDSKYNKVKWLKKYMLILLILQLTSLTSLALIGEKIGKKKEVEKVNGIAKSTATILQQPGDTVVTQHFPGLNQGRVDGSIRVLLGEAGNILSGTIVSGSLFVPGTPTININSSSSYNGTVVGTGNSSPTGYSININNNVSLKHVVTKTDPITLPSVTAPRSLGRLNLSLSPGQTVSDFSIVRDITLNSNYGQLVVPPGSYGDFTAFSNSGFTFGIDGQNTIYNLHGLILSNSTQLQIRGNVTLNLANVVNIGASTTIGNSNNPIALLLKTTATTITLNTNSNIYGVIQAPLATVNVSSGALLKGSLVCDKLNLNGGLIQNLVADTISPSVTIAQPTPNQVINSSTTIVTGTFQDTSLVTSVNVNGVTAAINGVNYTSTIPLNNGNNTITVTATDIFGNTGSSSVNVVKSVTNNLAPIVNAGTDQSITLPTNSVTLNATVTDDGLPSPPAQTTVTWSKVSSPVGGTVTFSSPTTAITTATFNIAGTYILQLSASDSTLSTSDSVTITVNQTQQQNQPPIVNAGNDLTIVLPNSAMLNATVTDDGLPNPPAQVNLSWTQVAGNGVVTFSSPNAAVTQASFSATGTYTLRLTGNDSVLSASDDVIVIVNGIGNQPPTVFAGNNQLSFIPGRATLQGTASDDGLPINSTIALTWSKVSGNGTVSFTSPNQLNTFASFTEPGLYVLRLTATDGVLTSTSDVTLTIEKQPLLVIYSTLTGIEPREIQVSLKPAFIVLVNRTGLENLTYRLRDKNQQVIQTFTVPMASEMFVEVVFSSTNNEIFITEDNNPNWVCHITALP